MATAVSRRRRNRIFPFQPPLQVTGFCHRFRTRGRQADVYIARDQNNQSYAVKLYRGLITPSAATARALAELSRHRLLVPIFKGEWEGRVVEVTQLFPQGNLADLIKRNGPLEKEQALRLVRQVIDGLEELHGAGIQHRDLKPTNILVRSEAPLDLVLADFGLAAVTESTVLTQAHGTLFYSAPETLTGMYSKASDYWSLGIILVEALTGDSIAARLRNDALLPYRIVQGKVPIPPSIPKGWRPLLRGLLQRDHYRRWQAAEVPFGSIVRVRRPVLLLKRRPGRSSSPPWRWLRLSPLAPVSA